MRIQLPMRRLVLFLGLFLFALILTLPMRLAIGGSGLAAREIRGSIWSGRLIEARLGPAALGDLEARLAFLPLLTGRARLEVERDSAAADRFAGAFVSSSRVVAVESVTGTLPVEGSFGALPVAALELTDVTVRFRDDACEEAEGLVRATLTTAQPNLPQSLSASIRCDRAGLLLPLTPGAGGEGITLRVSADGSWTADLRLRGAPATQVAGRF